MKVYLPLLTFSRELTPAEIAGYIGQLTTSLVVAFEKVNNLATARLIRASLKFGDNVIYHGLGRRPEFWVTADITAPVILYRKNWNDEVIVLNASAACEVALWLN